MSLKIFHTGDIHLGMKFNGYIEDVRKNLAEARFLSMEKMIEKANALEADLFVIAGDLFNTTKVSKKEIKRTVQILNQFNGACVLVLPGNHDYYHASVELWNEFTRNPSEKILLLCNEKAYSLEEYGLDVMVYPAFCHSKHAKENSLGWIKEAGLEEGGSYHIGIAHGALEGLSADLVGNYYFMRMEELEEIPMDVWLIGHTHVPYPLVEDISNHVIYNAGTPEPDGLDYRGEGSAWWITLDGDKKYAKRISTGMYRFVDETFTLEKDEDLEKILVWIEKEDRHQTILRIHIRGRLSKERYGSISEFYKKIEDRVFYFLVDDSGLKIRIDEKVIHQEFTEGSFPYVFLNALREDEDALQLAYDLLRRK